MAKKIENNTDKENKATKPGTKGKLASKGASEKPKRSGQVKGPMGVGKKEKAKTTAKAKTASKIKKTAENSIADKKKEVKEEPKESAPKSTSTPATAKKAKVGKKAISEGKEVSAAKKAAKFKTSIIEDEPTPKETSKAVKNKKSTKIQASEEKKGAVSKKPKKTGKSSKPTKQKEISVSEKTKVDSLISEYDVHLFKEGKHFHLYKKLGSHLMEHSGTKGVYFAVWAPNAKEVSVIGDFNEWDKQKNPMNVRHDESGIWEIFVPEAKNGSIYKYFIRSNSGYEAEKGDPYAFLWENPPNTASVVWDLENTWNDSTWMEQRKKDVEKAKPYSVYELHIGSWRRVPEENSRSLTYKELAEQLPQYLKEMNFSHVEFMPVMEHPFFGSWGYQVTGYFAPSSRFGSPQDFMQLIDALHQAEIGVLLDWVPSHFPGDLHGLHYFDGTFLYEHADPQKGFHPDWQSYIFNYGRNEVRSFLISNALFWLDKFHADGLRVDAVASMLYLDYSRKEGEWQPNEHGGNENLEAIDFIKEFNEVVYNQFPDVVTIAEESTAWPMVSKPTYMGGLGFGMKWMMGWMHDTLEYFKKDPIHRKHHQNVITFSTNYAFSENFMLPLSHDEVVYGKEALINKMPGDPWNKFANLRSLYAYMYAHPGTKLLFMGAEFGQTSEWDHDSSLDWHLTNEPLHKQLQESLKRLNVLYNTEPALYEKSFEAEGFEWIDINDAENSVISFVRKGKNDEDTILVICNLAPVAKENYRIGVPEKGEWKEIFNSDEEAYGGSNVKNQEITATELPIHNKDYSVALTLPPMAVVYLKREL